MTAKTMNRVSIQNYRICNILWILRITHNIFVVLQNIVFRAIYVHICNAVKILIVNCNKYCTLWYVLSRFFCLFFLCLCFLFVSISCEFSSWENTGPLSRSWCWHLATPWRPWKMWFYCCSHSSFSLLCLAWSCLVGVTNNICLIQTVTFNSHAGTCVTSSTPAWTCSEFSVESG